MTKTLVSSPVTACRGELKMAGDKSISHRALLLASIAVGQSVIRGFLPSDDCLTTLSLLQTLGVAIERCHDTVTIEGVGKQGFTSQPLPLDCGNSGTTMRLLCGLLAASASTYTLIGDASLMQRPMERIGVPLRLMGANITTVKGYPPIQIKGSSSLKAIRYVMPIASAQVKSAIILAGMHAKGHTEIIETWPTRDHTERLLRQFSYSISTQSGSIIISGEGQCRACEIEVPGDISSAAFFIVAATLIPNSKVYIKGIGVNPTRLGAVQLLQKMGARIEILHPRVINEEPVADVLVQSAALKGITIASAWVPLAIDEFPLLFIAAACATGQTVIKDAQELRVKESDRISVMAKGLRLLGITVTESADGVVISGGKMKGGIVDSCGDHRIAMAFAIAGAIAQEPITVLNTHAIATSFPLFMQVANELQLSIREYNDYSE